MIPKALVATAGVLVCAALVLAADKQVTGTIVKVDVKKQTISVMTDDGKKDYEVNADTKFIGPRGGVSDQGIKDDRLKRGAEITLVIAGNNRTVREVRLPEKKGGR